MKLSLWIFWVIIRKILLNEFIPFADYWWLCNLFLLFVFAMLALIWAFLIILITCRPDKLKLQLCGASIRI